MYSADATRREAHDVMVERDSYRQRVGELERENARLRKALEAFADDRNWFDSLDRFTRESVPAWRGPLKDDPEKLARAALAAPEVKL